MGARRVGIMLPNWIGDVVMATPALRALRGHFGDGTELVGIMNRMAADVVDGSDFVDHLVYYERRSRVRGLLSTAARIRQLRLEQLILFPNSFSSALLAYLGCARERIGYGRYGRSPLLTTVLPPPRSRHGLVPVSAVDYYLDLARAVGCAVDASPRLELSVTNPDRLAADRLFERKSIDASRPLVTLNNGGGYGAAKKWPLERVIDFAERLVTGTDASVLFVCGPAERGDAARIEQAVAAPRIYTLADMEPSIGLTKACVERSDVLVSTDSGVRHFAAAFDVPCVTLFGPSDPRWSHNYHAREQRLRIDLACSPCGRRTCPLRHHRCMRDISVDQVLQAVAERLPQPWPRKTSRLLRQS